jgi:sugar phosphate isomerase/epimerase
MVPSLLYSSSSVLGAHTVVGCSTGYMVDDRSDWATLVARAAETSSSAIELSALSEEELPGLLDYLATAPRLPFHFVSVHGPTKGRSIPDSDLVDQLRGLPPWVSAIVLHPDSMADVAPYGALGRRLVIENMDARKHDGQTVRDLKPLFAALPEARFCFDVAHAKAVDPSMEVGSALLSSFATRLSHVHVSSLDEQQHHVPLTRDDEALFSDLLRRCADVPWILEAPPS